MNSRAETAVKTSENNEKTCRDASSTNRALTERLRAKYVEIAALRADRRRGEDRDASARLRALAERFPGALRELDGLSDAEIAARIASLTDAVRDGVVPAWAAWLDRYHAWMRVALMSKRGVSARSTTHAEYGPTRVERLREMDAILKPPGGRLNTWAFALVASEFRVTGQEIEALLCESNVLSR